MLAQASKLDASAAFIGSVGDDVFGRFVRQELENYGMDLSALSSSPAATTTMAIVSFDQDGERSFDFIRAPGADTLLALNDAARQVLSSCRILEYGSLSFSAEPSGGAVFEALETCKAIHAYDPNLRRAIWKNDRRMQEFALKGMAYADIVKLGDTEALFLTERKTISDAVKQLRDTYQIPNIFVTKGKHGCDYFANGFSGSVQSVPVKAVDTTGAGDSFFGALLCRYLDYDCRFETEAALRRCVRFACVAGALSASRKGTMEAMPDREEIDAVLLDA